ncbi:hypothetical protein ACLB2K_011672 [Fragaria x ananassa]
MVVQDSSPIEFTMTPYEYVNSLCPRTCKCSSRRKTALLYRKKESSSRKKDDDNLRTARNYILNSFRKNPVISNAELNVYSSLKPHFDKTLKFLVVYRPSTRDWKLKEHSDVSFAELYPEISES